MFVDVQQCKRIIQTYLDHTGRGGFLTGKVSSVSPLKIRISDKLELDADDLYVTDNCIGLHQGSTEYRPSLKIGDAVLLLCRPASQDAGIRYILLDRVQPYKTAREVST